MTSMVTWHVWGDFIHTVPQRIGTATLVAGDEQLARTTAEASGFDFDYRSRNGFEPWSAVFTGEDDTDEQAFAFRSENTVRGFRRR